MELEERSSFFINLNDNEVRPDNTALIQIQTLLIGNEKSKSKQVRFSTDKNNNEKKSTQVITDNDIATLDFTYHPLTSRKSKVDGLSKI